MDRKHKLVWIKLGRRAAPSLSQLIDRHGLLLDGFFNRRHKVAARFQVGVELDKVLCWAALELERDPCRHSAWLVRWAML